MFGSIHSYIFHILRFLVLCFLSISVYANNGIDWLTNQSQPDGNYSTVDDIATPFMATTQTLQTFYQLEESSQSSIPKAVEFVNSASFQSTESLSQKLIVQTLTNQPLESTINELAARVQYNGGLGDLDEYDRTTIDTALALEALAMTPIVDTAIENFYQSIKFLLDQQQDGGWADNNNETSIYVTAVVMKALWHYRNHLSNIPTLNVVPTLDKAQTYLLNELNNNNENFEIALALIAILPRLSDQDEAIAGHLKTLGEAQLDNGSWDNDVYTTALALRTIQIAEAPISNPDLGQIIGTVIDSQTGLALSGIDVQLTGTENQTTGQDGKFNFSDLTAGDYTVKIGNSLTNDTHVNLGQIVNLGSIRIIKTTTTATVHGTITDSTTNEPLVGATIQVANITVTTDEQGNYVASNINSGDITLKANYAGYVTATTDITVTANMTMIFSLALAPDFAAITGIVTDGDFGIPLSDADILVNGTLVGQTKSDGSYLIKDIPSGEAQITVEHSGYDSSTSTVNLLTHKMVNFSPKLFTVKTAVSATGIVLDGITNQALVGVNIFARFGLIQQTLTTDAEGKFTIADLMVDELNGDLRFTIDGYVTKTMDLSLVANTSTDIGQVSLQSIVQLPDLTVTANNSNVKTNLQTLTISGNLIAIVTNAGTATTVGDINLLAFYDVDLNDSYEADVDTLLGEAVIQDSLAVAKNTTVAIGLTGELPFRDAPIKVVVDSLQTVVESDESNNVDGTERICGVTFETKLKWKWTGGETLPNYNQVASTTVVAPLEDTNGDGKINQFDIPAVIFPTYKCEIGNSRSRSGVLRAISGKDGSDLWVTNEEYKIHPTGNIAVADIDNDGIVEIIASRSYNSGINNAETGGTIVFEHTGKIKWQVPHPLYSVHQNAISIADLNGDSTPEIIIGNAVLNSTDGSFFWQGDDNDGWNGTDDGFDGRFGMSIVADINLDGKPEVIAGSSAYSNTGQRIFPIKWPPNAIYPPDSSSPGDGFTAIGNFNEDEYPEIILSKTSSHKLFLLNFSGEVIGESIFIYNGGGVSSGNPIIADMDGDSIPEIGLNTVINDRSRYKVFQITANQEFQELGSLYNGSTGGYEGSSAFDFDFDGQSEIVSVNKTGLYIIGRKNASLLSTTSHYGNSQFGYPVIADVDNDNHADIVVGMNYSIGYSSCNDHEENVGIRVYQEKNNRWANTRKIWNQHSYHITNINDDGTVPAVEQNSWQLYNTYRSQPVLDNVDPIIMADLTASRLQIIGIGQPTVTLQVRIGNAGAGDSAPNMPITFYAGNPSEGGIPLGTVMLDPLTPNAYQDVQLPNVTLTDLNQDIYAVIDTPDTVDECSETNNSVFAPMSDNSIASAKGIVMSANQPLAGVSVEAAFGNVTQNLITDAEGKFSITDLLVNELNGQVKFTIAGYDIHTLDVLLIKDDMLDIGQVDLQPDGSSAPDLIVSVNNISTDPQTLTVLGDLTAEVSNIGNMATSGDINLLAFYDVNLNDTYEANIDMLLGETAVQDSLVAGETTSIAISLTGKLPFMDATVKVLVDSSQTIVELDEDNNVGTTIEMCKINSEDVTFEPVLKWEWTGSTEYPEYKQVMSTPVVAPLEDTNGDGKINQFDMPAVIFMTYKKDFDSSYGVLRAVDGKDGSELWAISYDNLHSISNIAVADIDNDNKVEIIASTKNGKFVAFENTGEFKWESELAIYASLGGGISIADLNNDNTPEIISGNAVLNAQNGKLLWPKPKNVSGQHRSFSVVADINLDKKLEVIDSLTGIAYSSKGDELWKNNEAFPGFIAIGNFNEDNYPEIIVTSGHGVSLINHNGEKIWGPIPYFNRSGNPIIFDINNDGISEIGIVSKNKYVVLEGKDGTELWSQTVKESSSFTSSSAFDFNDDGQVEIIYAGNEYLYIFQGKDGTILSETPNTSGTALEYPIVVDVDNDNHADIIVAGNSSYANLDFTVTEGIRVYQEKNNRWANTRKIWNQYGYHITNINDDGTVPIIEQNSWQVHNTYHSQPSLGLGGTPDLTIGNLQIVDNGIGQPINLQVRVGNAGMDKSSSNIPVVFYSGNPAAETGIEIDTVVLDSLSPGLYQDVHLTNVILPNGTQEIYAVIDPQNTLEECNEGNNSIFASVNSPTPIGIAGIVVDASNNKALADVNITIQLDGNTQILTSDFEGKFNLNDLVLDDLNTKLSFTIDGYISYTLDILLAQDGIFDIGQVRLRPDDVTVLLPDLIVTVNNINIDPQTLTILDGFTAEISNIGTAPTSNNISVLSFYDINSNNIYESDIDVVLGNTIIPDSLGIGENITVTINSTSQLPFRDAPITVLVDNLQTIVESDETNNFGVTNSQCRIDPAPLPQQSLKLKWHWDKADVLGPPVVGQLSDDNGDGKIDYQDIPDLVFPAGDRILYVLSGDDGHELWNSSKFDYNVLDHGSAAIGDIDNDGIVEIVVPLYTEWNHRISMSIGAFEHDGTPIWIKAMADSHVDGSFASGVAIADLEHDGIPEIIYGNHVFNHDGQLRWEGKYDKGSPRILNDGFLGYNSIVADIDLDGIMEVIAGRTVYDGITGDPKWHQSDIPWNHGDGYNAIGNFDEDDFAEIVLVYQGSVYLLEHDKEIKWGPVILPSGGYGGPPTIADIDNDGEVEIGVSSREYYTVFETDGSIKWSSPKVNDASSAATGSSVFDFEGDGKVEILYADEDNFYIYGDGGDHAEVLLQIPNGSGTKLEYPIVVDLDNDNHAELVVTASRYGLTKNYQGIRVFEAENDNWPATRKIWNQHSYHITNINDDGTIPQYEQPSWLVHNTYRLNTIPGQSVTGIPDLTAGHFQLIDNGIGQPLILQVRIGNAGLGTSPANTPLTFYSGNPAEVGTEPLGTVMLDALAPNTYQDIQLPGIEFSSLNQDIYAVIDVQNTVEECNEANNSIMLSASNVIIPTVHGQVTVATDAPSYGPNTPTLINYTISNLGALPADFKLELRLEDGKDEVVKTFTTPDLAVFASGDSLTLQANWDTGTTLAGRYQVHAILTTPQDEQVGDAIQTFDIIAGIDPLLKIRATTDKPSYHSTDMVMVDVLLQNLSINTIVDDMLLTLTVTSPDGQVQIITQPLTDLPPNGLQQVAIPHMLTSAGLGTYNINVKIADSNATLIEQNTSFTVAEDLQLSVIGQIELKQQQLNLGQSQVCTATVTNQGTQNLTGLPVQYLLVNLDTMTTISSQTASLNLAPTANNVQELTYNTLALPVATYACILQAELESEWQTLDFESFNLNSILSTECSTVYSVHDKKRRDSQLFSYDLTTNNIAALGPLYLNHDLEGLDIHPQTNKLYASSGTQNSRLYQVDGYTGDLTLIDEIGFHHVNALSFHPNGELWAWSSKGIIKIDIDTGKGTLIRPTDQFEVQAVAWNNAGTRLYATTYEADDTNSLLSYDGEVIEYVCVNNMPGEIEGLEIHPNGHLMFGLHEDDALSFHFFDVEQCEEIWDSKIITPYNDIEAIAWPTTNCTILQTALKVFLAALSEDDFFVGEDRNVRVNLGSLVYQGQLAEEIIQGSVPEDDKLKLVAIPDTNADGNDDFLITYPDGKQQILYFLGTVEE